MALSDNVKASWNLNGSGSTAIDDLGNHNGTVVGTTSVVGHLDNARDMDGVDDEIGVASGASVLNGTNSNFTISFWVEPDDTTTLQHIYDEANVGGNARIHTRINADQWGFFIRNDANSTVVNINAGTVTLGYQNLVFTYDGTNAKMFVNGVLRGITSVSIGTLSIDTIKMGRNAQSASYSEGYNGELDAVVTWTRAITDGSTTTLGNTAGGEVAELFSSGNGLPYPFIDLIAQSTSFESNNGTFVSATLTPTFTGNTPTFRIRADKTKSFEDVSEGVRHFFSNTGSEVQWQVEGLGTTLTNIKIEAFR